MKAQVKDYMSLTKKEWNGMLVLVFLIMVVIAAPYVYQWFNKDKIINTKDFEAAVVQLNKANPARHIHQLSASGKTPVRMLFKFDPNHLPAEEWAGLGLSAQQIAIIFHYEAKGGKFFKPEDLKKIYGITAADYNRLAPYIRITRTVPEFSNRILELNTADSAHLTSLAGIGPAFAKRIIYYRERLGGFINKGQLKEVYGLDEFKYEEIQSFLRVDASRIRKIDINSVTFDKLRLMPYLGYKQVNAIIAYRNQHGSFTSMDDLKNIAILDERILRKIDPYLIFK